MKKQFLSVLAFSAILLSSCGGTAKIEKASACGQEGEITASSAIAIAETESGKVAGYVENGIYIYKGIPYAKAERFMPPVAADKWEGVRSSRAYGPTCPQGKRMGWYSDEQAFAFNWDDGYPDENCLRVNIWTPGLKDGKKRPVMVWLHGGGYSAGSGQELPSYDGTNLAKKGDAVVVTLNHRLNVLGFLDLSAYGDKYAKSGNAGLLDLVAALQWVNKNIESFGGDARNVTIFGQSGGGGKVSTLLATPSARGLFHKAIVQSGSMLRTMEQKYSRRIGSAVMEELGLKASQIDELCKMPYDKVLAAGDKAIAKVRAEAEKEKMIREAEGEAEAILKVQQANADGIKMLKEAGADAAAGYLNEIRRRSPGLAPATAATITDDMILDERSKELFGEGQRFFDMMRMGRTIEFNDDFQDIPVSHRGKTIDRTFEKIVLPISQDEINANPALENQQNPGY